MSTIYDALKKIESRTQASQQPPSPPKPKLSKPKLFLLIYIICALILIGLIHLLSLKSSEVDRIVNRRKSGLMPPISRTPSITKPEPLRGDTPSSLTRNLPALSITGIFFSDGEYIALINNQTIKAGDYIEGVKIEKIDSNGVTINFQDASFRLNYPQ